MPKFITYHWLWLLSIWRTPLEVAICHRLIHDLLKIPVEIRFYIHNLYTNLSAFISTKHWSISHQERSISGRHIVSSYIPSVLQSYCQTSESAHWRGIFIPSSNRQLRRSPPCGLSLLCRMESPFGWNYDHSVRGRWSHRKSQSTFCTLVLYQKKIKDLQATWIFLEALPP